MGFAGLAVALAAALYVGFGKKIRVANLAVGALTWWLLLVVATSVLSPPPVTCSPGRCSLRSWD